MTSGAAAFFDVDNTIIRGASSYHLARELRRRGIMRRRDIAYFAAHAFYYFLFGENKKHIDRVRARALGMLRGHSVAEMVAVAEEVYEQVLTHRIFPGARDLIEQHRQAGDQVWIVTAAPREVGELVAHRLELTGVLGTVAEHRDGVYTGKLAGDMMHGEHKAAGVRRVAREQCLDLAVSAAYGDSSHDIPMLRTVGNPCAINPDPRLRLFAADIGWPVRDFRRRRRNVRGGLRTASQAGAVWVAATALRALSRAVARKINRARVN